ncbi:MAG: hypothetical protein IKC94_03770 [Lentisphaeria bacterium]|nr:hypothetical protein [Lentisphaeria bacterium]
MKRFLYSIVLSAVVFLTGSAAESGHAAAEKAAAEKLAAEKAAAEKLAAEKAAAEKLAAEKAAAEKAVIAAVTGHRSALLSTDFKALLAHCSSDYRETDGNSRSRSYEELEKLAGYFQLMQSSDDLEVVMENALLLQGSSMSDFQRQQIISEKNSARGKELLTMLRTNFAKLAAQGRELAAHIRVSAVRINGDRATAVLYLTDPLSRNTYRCDYQLVKHDGKWLVSSTEVKGTGK